MRRESRRGGGAKIATLRTGLIWLVCAIAFLATGFNGLVFEVLWIRLLSTVFGTTIHGVATTLAAFLGGLGIGAFALGRYVDRHEFDLRRLLLTYATLETSAAGLALALCLGIPHLQAVAALLTSGDPGPAYLGLRAAVTLLLLLPATFLMGGSLPVLSKALLTVSPGVGSTVGSLYAINTLGAALGALLVDAWLVINVGIARTAALAFASNVVAALLVVGFVGFAAPRSPEGPSKRTAREPPLCRGLLLGVYCASGFCALGYEVAWSRVLLNELFSSRFAISTMLGIVLLGLVAGSAFMACVLRRRPRVRPLLIGAELLVGVSAIASLYAFERWTHLLRRVADGWAHKVVAFDFAGVNLVGIADNLPQALVLQAFPAFFLGAVLPLIAQGTVSGSRVAGRGVGIIYLWNTLGAIAGSLATGFLLLPHIGAEGTLQALATLSLVLGIVVAGSNGTSRRRLLMAAFSGAVVTLFAIAPKDVITRREAASLWATVPLEGETLYLDEGLYQTLAVREYRMLGSPVERRLVTNSYSMSGTSILSNRYMRLMAHIPLLLRDSPRRAALIAFGVGNTARAIAAHPVEQIDVVEISKDVIRLAGYFADANHDVLSDPRVAVHINDGRNFLLATEKSYDLITFEPPPPCHADVVDLYTKEYYEIVRSRLAPGGLMTQWLPIVQAGYTTNLSMIRSVLEVFPCVTLWTGALHELIICAALEPVELNAGEVEARIADRHLAASLCEIGVDSGESLLSTFLGSRQWLERLTADVPPVTDDNRLLEYDPALRAVEPSYVSDYYTFYRSGQYLPALDTRMHQEVRDLCIWGVRQIFEGGMRYDEFAGEFLPLLGSPHNLYLADAMVGVPRPAQEEVLDPSNADELVENRYILLKAIWHHLLRRELRGAARLTEAGLGRWPGDPELELKRAWILELARRVAARAS